MNAKSQAVKESKLEKKAREEPIDPVDEAAMESFPASDPPYFTGSTASPSCPEVPDDECEEPSDEA